MAINAALSLMVVVAFACLVYGPWQWACTDFARQFLFEQRAKIFDLAREGRLSFASEEYRTIRASLEQSIRFAHEMTWPRFLLFMWILSRHGHRGRRSNMQIAIDRIADAETQEAVRWIVARGYGALVLLAIVRSPAMWLLAPVWLSALLAIFFIDRVRRIAKIVLSATGDLMQVQAENAPPETLDQERTKVAPA